MRPLPSPLPMPMCTSPLRPRFYLICLSSLLSFLSGEFRSFHSILLFSISCFHFCQFFVDFGLFFYLFPFFFLFFLPFFLFSFSFSFFFPHLRSPHWDLCLFRLTEAITPVVIGLDSPFCTIARILRSDFDLVSLKPIFLSPISRLHVQFQLITSIFTTMPNSRLLRTYAFGHCIMVHTCVIS